jgi:serine-type D-Ala-D-Ala endopeptidase (penicillin-binding protein 7)
MLISLAIGTAYSGPLQNNITAQSWLVADGNGKVLQSENTNEVRSIASISKLMTVMVVLDAKQDLDQYIKPYTRRELIDMALVHSDNRAADQLCENYPGGKTACIHAMNNKAKSLGMTDTRFIEPTGLSVFNVSTANDLVKLVLGAKNYAEIVAAAKLSEVKIKLKKKWLVFRNTNPIIGKRHDFTVSKTGYIRASGGCIVMMLDTEIGQRIVVLLGSKNTHTRIPEAEFIATRF